MKTNISIKNTIMGTISGTRKSARSYHSISALGALGKMKGLGLAACLLVIGCMQVWGTTTYTYDLHSVAAADGGSEVTYWFSDITCETHIITRKSGGNNISESTSPVTVYYKDATLPSTAFSVAASSTSDYVGFMAASPSTLIMGKEGAIMNLPTYSGEKITNVTITTSSTCSTNAKFSVYSGANRADGTDADRTGAVSTDFSFDIDDDYQEDALTIKVTTAYNLQISTIAITTELAGYAVTYNNGGHGTAPSSTTATAVTLPALTAAGYINTGWKANVAVTNTSTSASISAGTLIENGTNVTLSQATTFTAQWRALTNYHTRCLTVTYAAGEGSGVGPSNHTMVNPNSTITLEANTFTAPTGKAFDGWHDGTSKYAAGASYTVTASKTMTAQWAFVDYNVTYSAPSNGNYTIKVADGAASSATKTAHYGQTITLNATPNTGYSFTSWTVSKAGGGTVTVTNNQFTMPAENVTVTATFTIIDYNVTYVAPSNGNYTIKVGSGTASSASKTANYGQTITLAATPNTGYSFSSWTVTKASSGTVTVTSNQFTMPAEDVTVTAAFSANNYTITLNNQSATTAGTASVTATYDASTNLTSAITKPEKTNYVFAGYFTETDGGGTQIIDKDGNFIAGVTGYTDGSKKWKYAGDITLYAKWAVASVTVSSTTTYYTTLAGALAYAKDNNNSTITVLGDITNQTALTYNPTEANTCTLDLNNYTVAGTVTKLLTINKAGANFIITDNSVGKGGALSSTAAVSGRAYGVYITNGTLNLKNGHISIVNTTASKTASGVYVSSGTTFIMDGGKVESEAPATAYGVHGVASTTSTITINGGEIYGHTNTSTEAVGLYTEATGLTVNGGTIKSCAHTKTSKGIYLYGGSATINGGYIEAITDTVGGSGSTTAYGIQVANKSPNIGSVNIPSTSTVSVNAVANTSTVYAIILGGGTDNNTIAGGSFIARAKTGKTAYGVNSSGTTTISGGTFKVITKTTTAYGIYSPRGTVTVSGSPVFNIKSGSSTAYGALAYGTIGAKGMSSTKFSGTIIINGGTFNVTSTTTTAYGANAGLASLDLRGKSATNDTVPGMHYMPGIIEINDGTFNVTATTTGAYGVFVAAAKSESGTVGTTTRIPLGTITGGKFKVQSSSDANATAYAMNTAADNTDLVVQGGYYSTKRTDSGNIEDKYTATGKSCNYHVFNPTDLPAYPYKVAEGYTLTWDLADGTVTTAGTGAAVGATGTPNIVVEKGASISAPTVTKTGYNFSAWSPAVADNMPAANTTYTATWTEKSYTVTFYNGSHGTVKVNGTTVANAGTASVNHFTTKTLAVTANTGYTFAGWTKTGGVVLGDASAASTTITATAAGSVTATWTANTYDVTLNTNGGTINAGNVTSYTYGVGATLPTNVTKTGYTFAGWYDNSGLTGSAVTTISTSATGDKEYWAKWTTVALTFTGAVNSNWNNSGNWSPACVPTIEHDVMINKPCVVNVTDAQAKSVVLNQSSGKTGQLVLDAGKELVVATTVKKTTDGSNRLATGENDLVFNSTSSLGLGALVIGTHDGSNNATVNFATLSNGEEDNTGSDAQYVGTPFGNHPKMIYQFYNSWMYKFVNTGVPGWTRVDGEDGLDAFQGYCIFSADGTGHSYWMQGTLVASTDQTINLRHNGGDGSNANNENMLANSWMAPIQIAAFDASDFTNADATIYIYNTGSPDDYRDNNGATSTGTQAGQYSLYPVNTCPTTAIIPSMQAFSVYTHGSTPSISLDYSKIVYDPAVAGSVVPGRNRAPQRTETDEPEKMRLYIGAESGYGDMLYMLEREDFAEGFENGWDGRKMFGEDVAPQLYAFTPDGNMAINCIPTFEGQLLGFRAGTEDNMYTFSFEYDGDNMWYLNDLKEQTSTLISSESRYMFMASDEDMAARFIISAMPISKVPTSIENGEAGKNVHKLLIDGILYIIRNGRMYDATGVMIR